MALSSRGVALPAEIFEQVSFEPGRVSEFPLRFGGPQDDDVAMVMPASGAVPEAHVSGDYVIVPRYRVGGGPKLVADRLQNDAWQVLLRASSYNHSLGKGTPETLEARASRRFGVAPSYLDRCEHGGMVAYVRRGLAYPFMPVTGGPMDVARPPGEAVVGFAVLDCRQVLSGTVVYR